jgi:uncharacterized protein YciI
MKQFLSIAVVVLLALISTLASASDPEHDHAASSEGAYVFVYLVLDHPEKLSQAEMGEAMQGHFDNMSKLADEEKLLIAGPLADPRISEAHRGIFVLSAETIEQGRAIGSTDPAVKAGVFKLEMYTFTTDAPLRKLPQLERDAEAARLADPDVPDEWVGRIYMLAVADDDALLPETDAVLIDASMTAEDGDTSKRLLFVDAQSADDAEELFGDAADQWTFYGWYGSGEVAKLGE